MNRISAPASKSYMQRALAISALAEGLCTLKHISWCNDTLAAKELVSQLGSEIQEEGNILKINSTHLQAINTTFSANESGLCIRMFSPILSLLEDEIHFTGQGSLLTRPVQHIADALSQLDVQIASNNGFLPLEIKGKIKAGNIEINGSISSQLLTGLLIVLPTLESDSEILVHQLKSKPYIDMTLSIMKAFGVVVEHQNYQKFLIKGNQKYKSVEYDIEGDWSAAAFFLVAGAVKDSVTIDNLNPSSAQADRAILDVLEKVGAKISFTGNTLTIEKDKLNSFSFDATDCPDLFPPLVCLASRCEGLSEIRGVSRLYHKESNRAEVLKTEFAKIGVEISLFGDEMQVLGSRLKAGTIDSNNDHRIAMAAGIMNLFCKEEISITGKDAVNKSYPNFFNDLYELEF